MNFHGLNRLSSLAHTASHVLHAFTRSLNHDLNPYKVVLAPGNRLGFIDTGRPDVFITRGELLEMGARSAVVTAGPHHKVAFGAEFSNVFDDFEKAERLLSNNPALAQATITEFRGNIPASAESQFRPA